MASSKPSTPSGCTDLGERLLEQSGLFDVGQRLRGVLEARQDLGRGVLTVHEHGVPLLEPGDRLAGGGATVRRLVEGGPEPTDGRAQGAEAVVGGEERLAFLVEPGERVLEAGDVDRLPRDVHDVLVRLAQDVQGGDVLRDVGAAGLERGEVLGDRGEFLLDRGDPGLVREADDVRLAPVAVRATPTVTELAGLGHTTAATAEFRGVGDAPGVGAVGLDPLPHQVLNGEGLMASLPDTMDGSPSTSMCGPVGTRLELHAHGQAECVDRLAEVGEAVLVDEQRPGDGRQDGLDRGAPALLAGSTSRSSATKGNSDGSMPAARAMASRASCIGSGIAPWRCSSDWRSCRRVRSRSRSGYSSRVRASRRSSRSERSAA